MTNNAKAERKTKLALVSSLMTKTPVLHLNLHGKYFDMIASGEKGEEYREIKPFYDRIFTSDGIKIKGKFYKADEVLICFSNGFARDRRQMLFHLDRIAIREGKTQWGAAASTRYYCLVLGRKIWQGTALELKQAESATNLIGEILF